VRKEHNLKLFEIKVLRIIFGSTADEIHRNGEVYLFLLSYF